MTTSSDDLGPAFVGDSFGGVLDFWSRGGIRGRLRGLFSCANAARWLFACCKGDLRCLGSGGCFAVESFVVEARRGRG